MRKSLPSRDRRAVTCISPSLLRYSGQHCWWVSMPSPDEESTSGQSCLLPSNDELILKCADLRYQYLGRFDALCGVSLEVSAGEKVALIGANGCGKSTLLKILDGLMFPDSGTYAAFGEKVTEDALEDEQMNMGFRSRIGFVFQNSDAQVFSPTVRDELAFGPLQLGLDRHRVAARIEDILALLGIADIADRAPFQLSGGQKKRVAIGTVLVMNPEVLLFDEPTAALDPRTSEWLTELIEDLADAGKTIVLATHDLDSLDRFADRCIVFGEDHTILAEATPAAVLADRELLLAANLIHARTRLPVQQPE
ncbi:ABC transporter ATP-binding protein [Nocardia sp. NPDC051990]|uniref:energy-coupling factor ABC transporter ATP-binding protein n=1 Tax=Nocardia sp. NPDC051990 TaxID=3155285 RepID=UPI003440D429